MKSRKGSKMVAIDLWVRSRLKSLKSSVSVSFLAPVTESLDKISRDCITNLWVLGGTQLKPARPYAHVEYDFEHSRSRDTRDKNHSDPLQQTRSFYLSRG